MEKADILQEVVSEVEVRLSETLLPSFLYFLSDFHDYIKIVAAERGVSLEENQLKMVLVRRLTDVFNEDETGQNISRSGVRSYSQSAGDVSESYTFNGNFRSAAELFLSAEEERILGLRNARIRVIRMS